MKQQPFNSRLLFILNIFVVLGTLYPSFVEGKGSFQSYNFKEREKYLESQNPQLNEVDAFDLHEAQAGFSNDDDGASPDNEFEGVQGGRQGKVINSSGSGPYKPTWESLDARPMPEWYDQSKIGIFIHWGVFSVPAYMDAWFWHSWKGGSKDAVGFMQKNYKPSFTYQDFGPQFTAEWFDPTAWAELFSKSGAKYIVLTSKHHEGFNLYPSKYGFSWNSVDVGPQRDLVGDLAKAIRSNTTLKFGLYHSLYEWFNPLYEQDKAKGFTTQDFVTQKTEPELYDIVKSYKPDVIWSDGDWEAPYKYWNTLEFLTWLYNDSPVKDTVVTNDRWGQGTMCKHGGFFTCSDKYNPGTLQARKWENCMTLDKYSWGFRRNAQVTDYLTAKELIATIVETVSCGGNILINVGPTKYGVIAPIMEERLLQMGDWLGVNGEAIYNSVPWKFQNDTLTPGIWYTSNPEGSKIFAMITNWPKGSVAHLGAVEPIEGMTLSILGYKGTVKWRKATPGIEVKLPLEANLQLKETWTIVIGNTHSLET